MEGEYSLALKTAAKKLVVFSMKNKIATEKVMNRVILIKSGRVLPELQVLEALPLIIKKIP